MGVAAPEESPCGGPPCPPSAGGELGWTLSGGDMGTAGAAFEPGRPEPGRLLHAVLPCVSPRGALSHSRSHRDFSNLPSLIYTH